jgi:hypothetical protein
MPLAKILPAIGKTFVVLAETIVHTREATVKSANSATVKSTHSATVKSTHSATVKSTHSAAMEPATTAVETPATTPTPAMRSSIGEIWLAERCSAQQNSCEGSQSSSYPGPGSIFA